MEIIKKRKQNPSQTSKPNALLKLAKQIILEFPICPGSSHNFKYECCKGNLNSKIKYFSKNPKMPVSNFEISYT